jgi:hypothetical protein
MVLQANTRLLHLAPQIDFDAPQFNVVTQNFPTQTPSFLSNFSTTSSLSQTFYLRQNQNAKNREPSSPEMRILIFSLLLLRSILAIPIAGFEGNDGTYVAANAVNLDSGSYAFGFFSFFFSWVRKRRGRGGPLWMCEWANLEHSAANRLF